MGEPWIDPTDPLIAELWPDAPTDEAVVQDLLDAAQEQCEAFLPHRTDTNTGEQTPVIPDPLPTDFKLAVLMQAHALHRSGVTGSGDQIGGDGLGVTVFPMDWTVKNLLRPKKIGRVL